MMAIILLSMVLFASVECMLNVPWWELVSNDLETRYRSWDDSVPVITQVACSSEVYSAYDKEITDSDCGDPKDVYVDLWPPARSEKVTPSGLWLKRCDGSCDFQHGTGSKCVPVTNSTKSFRTKVYSSITKRTRCVTYELIEHTSCSCESPYENSAARSAVYMPPDVPDYEPVNYVGNE